VRSIPLDDRHATASWVSRAKCFVLSLRPPSWTGPGTAALSHYLRQDIGEEDIRNEAAPHRPREPFQRMLDRRI
jgi:hypothetical protein